MQRYRTDSRRSSGAFRGFVVLGLAALAITGFAATTVYEYDALGRLVQVTHANGNVTTYTLDAAGNRAQVDDVLGQAAPASINVPDKSFTGSYSISWTAGGTVTSYELYESTVGSFATQTRVYLGSGLNASIAGHGTGTFYYRVRGCSGSACTGYRTGSAGVAVWIPPSAPSSITVPSASNSGSFTVSWGSATTGTVTSYQLFESANTGFSPETNIYTGVGTSQALSRSNGTYYYRAVACNGPGCSGNAPGPNQIDVTIPPGTPGALVVPSYNNTGSYPISWGVASGKVTAYELWEAANSSFSGEVRIYNSTSTATSVSSRGNGTYYYRLRACNGGQCSGYAPGANQTDVVLPPSTPSGITVPPTNNTGNILISWGPASGKLTRYELYEATNSSFTGHISVYSNVGTSTTVLGRQNGSYWYHVRACNAAECSGYAAGGPTVVSNVAPPAPTGLTKNQNSGCSWAASWAASSGATYYTIRDYSGNFQYNVNAPATSTTYSFCGAPGYTGNPNDYRPKWLKACNSQACSAQTNFP